MPTHIRTPKPSRATTWSNRGFIAVLSLLGMLGLWWTILIGQLVNENHALRVATEGDSPIIRTAHDRRRLMVWGESGTMALLTASIVAFAWATTARERQQLRRIEGILAASTHELKTPLAGVRALLESMASGVLKPENAAPHLARGLESCARLDHLVDAVLTWQTAVAHPDAALQRGEVRPLGIWLEGLLPGARVQMDDASAAPVRAQPEALRVILENLWENARKYGGGQIVVTADRTTTSHGPAVRLHIRDDGLGFEPRDAERIFEPYERLHTHTRGTGLGLYISRSLARAMNGELTAVSPGAGLGSTFTLTLPCAAESTETGR